jgi:hypothetical protein
VINNEPTKNSSTPFPADVIAAAAVSRVVAHYDKDSEIIGEFAEVFTETFPKLESEMNGLLDKSSLDNLVAAELEEATERVRSALRLFTLPELDSRTEELYSAVICRDMKWTANAWHKLRAVTNSIQRVLRNPILRAPKSGL